MENPKVSILVPIYNVEKYLRRCIESVLSQDFCDYELILVDDGSPDRCPQICDEYAKKDSRIKVVHKQNGGLVSARLAGFKEAIGEYVMHVDSDDYLLSGAVSTLYNTAKEGDYDVVKSRPLRENSKGKRWQESYRINDGEFVDNEAYTIAMLQNNISPYLHSSIYKKDVFDVSVFEKVMAGAVSIGEDWVTNMLISPKIRRAKILDESVYVYYWNEQSMMATTIISPLLNERLDKVLDSFYANASPQIHYEHDLKNVVAMLMANYFWEIPFNKQWYFKIVTFMQKNNNREKVEKLVEPRFMKFIRHRIWFKLYSRTYSLLKFLISQKGKRRNVIM